jgi:hypothetical protein
MIPLLLLDMAFMQTPDLTCTLRNPVALAQTDMTHPMCQLPFSANQGP